MKNKYQNQIGWETNFKTCNKFLIQCLVDYIINKVNNHFSDYYYCYCKFFFFFIS